MLDNKNKEITKEEAYRICQKFLGREWLDITLKDFGFQTIRGGLSNMLYHCSLPENSLHVEDNHTAVPKEVLLRAYGPHQESLESVVQEAAIFTLLSERGLGPKLYGIFEDGRLEEYMPSRSLKRDDIKQLAQEIGVQMAKVHSLQVPVSKQSTTIVTYLRSWLDFVEHAAKNTGNGLCIPEIVAGGNIRTEVDWLIEQMSNTDSPLVFCHNDLQGGNILLVEDKQEMDIKHVMLIDFEFGSYNYRGFDIANHFCEWCFNYNTESFPHYERDLKCFPNEKEQLVFIESYLNEMRRQGTFQGTASEYQEEKQKILEEVRLFRLTSSLMWCIWSFKMALTSSIKFGFVEYGITRWETYNTHKEDLLTNGRYDALSGS